MKETTDNNGNAQIEFNATLLAVQDQPKAMQNENQTMFRNCTIKFEDARGKIQQIRALIYEKSYQRGMEIGEDYLATARKTDDGSMFINLSHLRYAEEASNDMFAAFSAAPAEKEEAES